MCTEAGENSETSSVLDFFPESHIVALRKDILGFQQNEEETIGAAWARFSLLVKSDPVLSIPDHVLLQHFYLGLNKESTNHLDASAGGSFSHKTLIEGMEILYHGKQFLRIEV